MVKSFRWKLTAAFIATIVLLLVMLAGLGYVEFKNYYLNNLESRLTKEAYLIADSTQYRTNKDSTTRSYQNICIIASQDNSTRVTIVDSHGTVLGDSEVAPDRLENHSNRPEIYTALQGGVGREIRFSDTLGTNMLYIAVPFRNSETSGAVRLAMPMADLQLIYQRGLAGILAAVVIAGLMAFLLSFMIAQYFSRPLREITAAVREMGQGNLRRRITWSSQDEMGTLAQSFNEMGQHIEASISQISEVKNRLEAILNNTINGIVLIGEEQRLVYANPTASSLLVLGENFIGHKYAEVIRSGEILAMIDEVRSSGQPDRRVIVLDNHGSSTIEANVVPVFNEGISANDILLVFNDITEMKRLEQVRKDFVANVSHELKTPVSAISGFAETLLDEGGRDSDYRNEFTRIIFDEAQRLAHLINSLLTLSKLESEEVQLNLQPIELNTLIAGTISRMAKIAGLRNISINFSQPGEAAAITSDPDLIDQVMTNLLDNAIKYSPDDSTIEVGLETIPGQVVIKVKDNGAGIPQSELPRIFERFYRVDKARSRKTGGSGLGLAIVKHLIENLNGQVTVTSALGQGSVFSVTLPR